MRQVTARLSDMENEVGTTDPAAAAAQLAALRAGREAVADRAMQPWWYDVTLGVLIFVLFAQFSLHNDIVSTVVPLAVIAGCLGLIQAYRRITGFFVSGYRGGRTRRLVWIWLGAAAVAFAAGYALEEGAGLRGAMVVTGAVLGVCFALLSRWWTHVYIAELREEL